MFVLEDIIQLMYFKGDLNKNVLDNIADYYMWNYMVLKNL